MAISRSRTLALHPAHAHVDVVCLIDNSVPCGAHAIVESSAWLVCYAAANVSQALLH
jgi:hypothetical protein